MLRLLLLSLPLLSLALAQGSFGGGDISQGQIDFVSALNPNPPGFNAGGQSPIIRAQDLSSVDWKQIDRRRDEGWYHLYEFGERFYDQDIGSRPWNDQQIDLDFFFPYYGFRFNYTFIFPEGFIAFSYPRYIQPPYTFPNPKWPNEPDASIIAAFMTDQTFMSVGETRISHVWYRVVSRPPNMIGVIGATGRPEDRRDNFNSPSLFGGQTGSGMPVHRYYQGQLLKTQEGRIEDPEFLNTLTRDIRKGMVGARGFTADYALVLTWERMAYGGSPKSTQLNLYEQVKTWQNTYQMVLATDEIRSYIMFNYANINWTSATSAGALFGRGGKQSAIVGFNGGNGTGFVQLPYSAEGNSYKLVQFGSTQTAGRWLSRVDETIVYGGCINTSTGTLQTHTSYGTMLGGWALNVSGPCFRPSNVIKMQIDEIQVDCRRLDMVVARCVIPVNSIYKTGVTEAKLSVDGGKNFPFWKSNFYLIQPARSRHRVRLIDDPINAENNWRDPMAANLTLKWSSVNITNDRNAAVDITLWGYWEDVEGHSMIEIGSIAKQTQNTGAYSFNPRQLSRNDMLHDSWKRFKGGMIQVRLTENWMADTGDGLYWSGQIPFGWYYRPIWEKEYGKNWALDLCLEWFEYDGKRENFIMELEPKNSCPCTMSQALADFGRFTSKWDCDAWGNGFCYYYQGASHCVISTQPVWTGSGQVCCYDSEGWLMFSDDYEYNDQYLRWYSAGVPYRAHPWGAFPYKRPPYVPTLSNFYNDLLPFEYCCKWTPHCEFYFWRRQSSGCQEYRPPVLGFAYGEPHFITYDNQRYSFNGKGYYVLSMMKSPEHDMMIQVRMEQPPKTLWDTSVRATAITGVAARDNGSATIQVFARKDFRRWRYKMDIYADGKRYFQDMPFKKLYQFPGVTLRSPARNYDTSEIEIMFATGVGVKVSEKRGLLNVIISLPPNYNESYAHRYGYDGGPSQGQGKCSDYHRTMGLLGTWNNDKSDDLMSPDCNPVQTSYPANEAEARSVYQQFGERWRADGVKYPLLFQTSHKPLYDPNEFANPNYEPVFDAWRTTNTSFWESLIFSRDEVKVACQGMPSCEYDFMMTGRREVALDTLASEKSYRSMKKSGEDTLISCGPLVKNKGVIKYPLGNNYLDGVTVTFSCKPEYFLHGDKQRTCVNGSWTPGWWVWCRERPLETGLKWMTGILSAVAFILILTVIFCCCYQRRVKLQKQMGTYHRNQRRPPKMVSHGSYQAPPAAGGFGYEPQVIPKDQGMAFNVPVMEHEPGSKAGGGRFGESSA